MKKSVMLQPIRIGTMEIPNRFVMPPMGTNLANYDGSVSQRFIEYYAERAKGGFGLVTIEVTAVDPKGKAIMREPGLWCDEQIEGYRKVIEECHKYGAKVSVQLHHCGRETIPEKIYNEQPVSVDSIPCPAYRTIPRELTTEEVYELIEAYGDTAVRARKAGADAVEIHGGHSYLVAQFTSQSSNHRTDEFGGRFENRMRFPRLIIENIRRKLGSGFPVLYRISGEEMVVGGNNMYETAAMARYLEPFGIDAFNVSCGRADNAGHYVLAPSAFRPGYQLTAAAKIKHSVSVPVISTGRHTEPYTAEIAIENGEADLIAFGRQSIADPHLPNKFASNRMDELLPCISCLQGCSGRVHVHEFLECVVNPFTGREFETHIEKTEQPKKIMVVGTGPAGLVAAWISAQRGHKVTCYEKSDKFGGNFRIAAHPPGKGAITNVITSYVTLCKKNGVEFKMNTEVTADLIEKEAPDAVFLCTGATPLVPNIPGIKDVGAVTAQQVLDGKVYAGQKCLVIGGGSVGVETCDFLGTHLRNVTLIEMMPDIALDEHRTPRKFLLERVANQGAKIITSAKVQKFIEGGVVYEKNGESITLDGFDTIVLAMGSRAYNPLEAEIKDKVKEVYVVGEALKAPSNCRIATREAADIALKI